MNNSIIKEIRKLHNLMMRRIMVIEPPPPNEKKMPPVQFWVVEFLYDNPNKDMFQKDVEEEFDIAAPTATKIINSLESKGFLIREPVTYDARLKKLVLTEKAIGGHERFVAAAERFNKRLAEGISEEEQQLFISIMKRMENNISK